MEGAVLLDVLELLERRGARKAHPSLGQDGLDQVGQIHRSAGGGSRPDHGVELVDEEDRAGAALEGRHQGLEAFLEVAAEARPGEERATVEGEDLRPLEELGNVVGQEALREALDERGLSDSGLAHEDGVVLPAAAEHLHGALELRGPRPTRGSSFPSRARSVRLTA